MCGLNSLILVYKIYRGYAYPCYLKGDTTHVTSYTMIAVSEVHASYNLMYFQVQLKHWDLHGGPSRALLLLTTLAHALRQPSMADHQEKWCDSMHELRKNRRCRRFQLPIMLGDDGVTSRRPGVCRE